jgi:hypothetical protein
MLALVLRGLYFGEVKMKGTPAIYLGRIVDKEHFRTFVYGPNGKKKLVESWDEYEIVMESGLWFATVEAATVKPVEIRIVQREPIIGSVKSRSRAKPKPVPVEEVEDAEDVLPDDGSVFEVKDDFLPTESK